MSYPKLITAIGLVGLMAFLPSPVSAQHRGGGGGGGGSRGSGQAGPRGGTVHGAPPATLPSRPLGGPRYPYGSGRYPYYGRSPYYGHYPSYGYGYYYGYPRYYGYGGYYGYPGLSFGFSFGYPYYGGAYYGGAYYGAPYYGAYGYGNPAYSNPGYVAAAPGRPYGAVKLDVPQPGAEVYVDGYFVGMLNDRDAGNQPLSLEAGPHHLEIRAPGFEGVAFDVNIEPGRTITYRAAMRPREP